MIEIVPESLGDVPPERVRALNDAAVRSGGRWIVYWMTAFRRPHWNYSLDRALDWAERLGRPLVVLEALRSGYRWANDRLHAFILEGMADNRAAFARAPARYYAYVEDEEGAGKGLFAALAGESCVVVTDEFPCFMLPRMTAAAARQCPVRMEAVDSNGLLPLDATESAYPTAYAFRRHLQKTLAAHLVKRPRARPFAGRSLPKAPSIPRAVLARWPEADPDGWLGRLANLPIDHGVAPVATRGGCRAGEARLRAFVDEGLDRYGEERSDPARDATSGLSPYLHFGHVSPHALFARIAAREDWSPQRLAPTAKGAREGWWGMSAAAEGFLDEAVTWRELGYHFCARRPDDYDRYASLPPWARATLEEHAGDPREHVYELDAFERAATHDPLWNAAQRQLLVEGRIHNYLRMLWGKKILEWTASPQDALAVMIELNNKYALDGRNPNSYSGIFWCLGRFDRPWAPERPIFGRIRYMSSASAARKFKLDAYLSRYGDAAPTLL